MGQKAGYIPTQVAPLSQTNWLTKRGKHTFTLTFMPMISLKSSVSLNWSITLYSGGKLEYLDRTQTNTGRTGVLHTQKVPNCNSEATVCRPSYKSKLTAVFVKHGFHILWTEKERDLQACYQHSSLHLWWSCNSAYGIVSCTSGKCWKVCNIWSIQKVSFLEKAFLIQQHCAKPSLHLLQ